MKSILKLFRSKLLEGPGGINDLLPIAIPMFFSSVFNMLMMFIDRLFLSRVGIVHQAAAMSGGMTSWMVTSFFAGIVGYSSAIIAQYHGAKQKTNCVRMVYQALTIAVLCYPLILLTAYVVSISPVFSGHSALEHRLELRYFWYMVFGSGLMLMRFSFGSFFTGIGRTRPIMYGNLIALCVNLVANWILIFGHFGFRPLGLDGAAIGTLLSELVVLVVFSSYFFRFISSEEWRCHFGMRWLDGPKMLKLLRYGIPQGAENILGMIGFVFLVSAFHSYGDDMAAATTICFNWDSSSFHPIMGIQVGVTTLVGRYMGQGKTHLAVRTAHSGFITGISYACLMIILFVVFTPQLVGVFTPEQEGLDYTAVRAYAIPMLKLCGLYLMTDAVLLISIGTLRGAGDTFWCMIIHLINNIIMASIVVFCVRKLALPPLRVWLLFVICGILSSLTLFIRYKLGRWKKMKIIETKPAAVESDND